MDAPSPTDATLADLTALLERVRLTLAAGEAGGWLVGYEQERHPVAALPLDGLDPACRRAEVLAVAAGVDAAIKRSGRFDARQTFAEGAAALLPKVERRRFVTAHDAVIAGRGGDAGERLFTRALGADLVVAYVLEDGWRFSYVQRRHVALWDASPDTVHAGARSHLYHRAQLDAASREVRLADGYDAARATLLDDVWFTLMGGDGVPFAVPDRDTLLVGEAATAAAAQARYDAADYPLCPYPLRSRSGLAARLG
jgi:hypothetical protein